MDDFFDKLRKVQLSERRNSMLSPLPPDLFLELRRRVTSFKSNEQRLTTEEQRDYQNLVRVGNDIVARRKQKIVNKAQRDLANGQIASEGLASEERDFYLSFIALLKNLDNIVAGGEDVQVFSAPSSAAQASSPSKKPDADSPSGNSPLVKLRILEDVAEFVSSSMDSLGPYSPSQVVALPLEDAEMLLGRNLAERIDAAD